MRDNFDKVATGAPEREYFMGICELCGGYDHISYDDQGRTICEWCRINERLCGWKNKRLVRAIKREETENA